MSEEGEFTAIPESLVPQREDKNIKTFTIRTDNNQFLITLARALGGVNTKITNNGNVIHSFTDNSLIKPEGIHRLFSFMRFQVNPVSSLTQRTEKEVAIATRAFAYGLMNELVMNYDIYKFDIGSTHLLAYSITQLYNDQLNKSKNGMTAEYVSKSFSVQEGEVKVTKEGKD